MNWGQLSSRDRKMLVLGLVFVLFAGLYVGLVEPLLESRERLGAQLKAVKATQAWMLVATKEIETIRQRDSGKPVTGGKSLLVTVGSTARGAKLGKAPKRIEPQSDGEVRVWLEDVRFDSVLAWLQTLANQGIHVRQISFVAGKVAGLATVRVSLARGGNAS